MSQRSHTPLEFAFSCPLSSGLHARPASILAETASQFSAECSVTNLRNGLVGNVKSVLSVIATDVRYQDPCVLVVDGVDDHVALSALRGCIEQTLPTSDVELTENSASHSNGTVPRALGSTRAACIPGIPISRGIARGKVAVLKKITLSAHSKSTGARNPQYELTRVTEAVTAVRQRIEEKLKYAVTPVGAAVLQANLAIASDILLLESLTQHISKGKSGAEAIVETGEFFIDVLGRSENDYIRQRAADIEEVCAQLLEEMGETHSSELIELTEPTILVAEALAPQQLLDLDRRWLKAIVLENTATTSHAAILARSLGIPALVGVRNARVALSPGREVIVDANRGLVIAKVSSAARRFYDREEETLSRRLVRSLEHGTKRSTKDGKVIEIAANASSADEAALAFENGADGIGLFRTEIVFLGREDAPSEEEQFAIYSEVARRSCGRPVIIRTFDIGGDKKVPYLNLPRDENPFLGYRGSRIYDEHQELLQSQLHAILRASASGCVQIMAPMVSSMEEVARFKAAVAQARRALALKGVELPDDIKVGIMIEVPSVAFMIDELCRELDFFSLGTNDLCQYFFAADRGNAKVSSLPPVHHPAFLRFLDQIVRQIHRGKKWVGICGEMAADPRNLPLLLGLGLDEISVPASEIGNLQQSTSRWDSYRCEQILKEALACNDAEEVTKLLSKQAHIDSPQPLLTNELIVLGSASKSREEVIQEMIDAFYVCGRTEDRQALEEAIWAREAMGSTDKLGHGFAIPHCKTDAVTANSICVLRLEEPIHWDSEHSERVNMVVLLAMRDADPDNTHMQVFSSLARKLINDDFRQHLMRIDKPAEITAYLARQLDIPLHADHSTISQRPAQAPSR